WIYIDSDQKFTLVPAMNNTKEIIFLNQGQLIGSLFKTVPKPTSDSSQHCSKPMKVPVSEKTNSENLTLAEVRFRESVALDRSATAVTSAFHKQSVLQQQC